MDLEAIYLFTPPEHIAYVKFIFESYEDVGIIRTVDKKKSIIVLLAVKDFLDVAREIIDALKQEVPLQKISRPVDAVDDWLMTEIAENDR